MLKQFGEQLLSSLSQDYYFDLYLIDCQVIKSRHLSTENKRKYIQSTIKQYQQFHPKFQYSKIQKNIEVENYFMELINHDTLIHFKGTIIYKELYKILYLIDNTFEVQKLLNDSKKYPDKFAKIQSDLKAVKSFRKQYQNNLFGLRKIMDKGQSRFRYWITTVYIKNKKLTKFFTHLFIIGDFSKLKDFYNDSKSQELLLNELDFFLMQRTTISKVVKSFGILLYWEMVQYLKINRKEAEKYTSYIIYDLFKENFNAEELHKRIEIKSSIGYYPVFGASKKASLSKDEEQFISNQLYKQIQNYVPIEKDDFTPLFESYIKTPHIQYLEKYPVELSRKNPKYSSIN